jgi:hypothetical protein
VGGSYERLGAGCVVLFASAGCFVLVLIGTLAGRPTQAATGDRMGGAAWQARGRLSGRDLGQARAWFAVAIALAADCLCGYRSGICCTHPLWEHGFKPF